MDLNAALKWVDSPEFKAQVERCYACDRSWEDIQAERPGTWRELPDGNDMEGWVRLLYDEYGRPRRLAVCDTCHAQVDCPIPMTFLGAEERASERRHGTSKTEVPSIFDAALPESEALF